MESPILIRVRNVVSYVRAPRETLQKLDKALSVEVQGAQFARAHRPGWDGHWHPLNPISGAFPTGLLDRVRALLPFSKISEERVKPPQRALDPDILRGGSEPVQLDEYQLAGTIGILEKGRGVVAIATGVGKTEIGLAVGLHVPGKCVIVVHRKDPLHQWAERIEKRTGETAALIGDGIWDERAGAPETKFVVVIPNTALNDLELYKRQTATATSLVLDEVHRTGAAASWYKVAQYTPAYYRVGLTATPETGDPVRDLRLEAAAGAVILRERAGAFIARGRLTPVRVIFHRIQNPPLRGTYMEIRQALIEQNPIRNQKIVDLAAESASVGKRCLIICDTKRHVRMIAESLRSTGIRSQVLTGGHASGFRSSTKRDLRSGVLEVVLTTPIWDDSVDIPELEVLILAAGGKSAVRCIQRIGRVLRKSDGKTEAIVHDFFDTGNRYVSRHSQARIETCKREGFAVASGEETLGQLAEAALRPMPSTRPAPEEELEPGEEDEPENGDGP